MALRRGRRATGGFLAGFRDFIMRGNVVDLAVAVIIGGAFGKIIESFVADIITPALLNPAMKAAGVDQLQNLSVNGIKYGVFLAAIINFLIIAFCMYLVVKSYETAKEEFIREEAEAPTDPVSASQERLTAALDRLTQAVESKP